MKSLAACLCVSFAMLMCHARSTEAGTDQVRPFWGTEALWGFWDFGNDYLSKSRWKIVTATPEAGDPWKAVNIFDGDSETAYDAHGDAAPVLEIDLGRSENLGAFTVLTTTRPNRDVDSRMASYEFFVSEMRDERGPPVAAGTFDGQEGQETVVTFPPHQGRYVTLRAIARATPTQEVCIRELSLISAEAVARHQQREKNAPAEHKVGWDNRDTPEAVQSLGKEFLDLIFCTNDDINQTNLRNRPKLEAVGKLKAAGQFADAVTAFRDYYLDKLRHPQAFGIHANDLAPYGRGYGAISDFPQAAMDKDLDPERLAKQIVIADLLLAGKLTLGDGRVVPIGEPGSVDWSAPTQPWGYTTPNRQSYPYRELWLGDGLRPLFVAYFATKDLRYLKRWIAYMDDWAINCHFLDEIHPVTNNDSSLYPGVTTLRMLAAIALSIPYDNQLIPAPAFARIMRKVVMDSPLDWIVYLRNCANGWTPGAGNMLFAILVDEFKVAPLYMREARRRSIEDINVLQELPDGTETHQWPGYNFLLLRNAGALRLIDAREELPAWAQPVWERELHTVTWQRELTENLQLRATYMLHWGTPSGEYPLLSHQEPANEKKYKLREAYTELPSMLNDPVNARLYSTLYGDGAAGAPGYLDDWFPYGGYSISRDGWGDDQNYGSMFCSPEPGAGGVGSGCKNNAFAMSAYGMDLIGDDLVHAYVRPTSPIQVDGRRQMFDFYMPKTPWPTGHRGDLVANWSTPSPWRWHTSGRFSLMEGVYSGVYANQFLNRDDFVAGVSHQRLALHTRRSGLWIINDRLMTSGKHDYEQLWYVPLTRREFGAFKPAEIVIDSDARTLKTRRSQSSKRFSWDALRDITTANVNLSMYQFTDSPIRYDSRSMKSDEMYDWQRIGITWSGQGNQQIVTALFPRKPTGPGSHPDGTENDLSACHALKSQPGTSGFEAITPSGDHVTYEAASNQLDTLAAGGIQINGEVLLVEKTSAPADDLAGVVLGAKSMTLNGKAVALQTPDFEFSVPASIDAPNLKMEAIFRPIAPVRVLPDSDVFVDAQNVSLECSTPSVFITYTVDGTEPTPQSVRYVGPFRIDRTRVVKARAYREGTTSNPPDTSGTHATPTAVALYTRKLMSPADDVAPHDAGLKYEYYEGFWKDLWLRLDSQHPLRSGQTAELFDFNIIDDSNPRVVPDLGPREKTYAIQYSGYLKVPESGVYTFTAPHDYTHLDQVSGYELQLYVGHGLELDNNGTKRDSKLSYWYPATRRHAFGTWSVPLAKGFHEFKMVYIDFRTDSFKRENQIKSLLDCVWTLEKPDLLVTGPGVKAQPIPKLWLMH